MVKINPNPQQGEGTIWFDYFNVSGVPLPSTSSSSPSSSAILPSAAQKNSNNVGAIVRGVVGGSSNLILLVLLLLFYCWRCLSKDTPVEPCKSPPTH